MDATVTYQYSEQTSDNATVSQSVSGNGGWQLVGTATDTYSVTDSGTITLPTPTGRYHDRSETETVPCRPARA
jgi:hypothetical protein